MQLVYYEIINLTAYQRLQVFYSSILMNKMHVNEIFSHSSPIRYYFVFCM